MLSDETIEKLTEKLVERIEEANLYVLKEIAKNIKKIGSLSPTNAMQLGQMIKYGGSYERIIKKLSEITKLNVKDIEKIFDEVAKKEYTFMKQVYKYRGKDFLPYDRTWLKTQVDALKNVAVEDYIKFVNFNAIGMSFEGAMKQKAFKSLPVAYDEIMDTAILNIIQGKTSFNDEMSRILKEIGESGIRRLEYGNRSVRLDSSVRMQLKDAIMNVHNKTQEIIADEIKTDGWEITVHSYPAPDHALVQGKQFDDDNFYNFQNDKDAKSVDGVEFPKIATETGHDRRSIGQYNCYHTAFAIVVGVNKPQYTDKQLKDILKENDKGFEFEGKHYTMYEGTQLQRKFEREVRKQKDLQIIYSEAGESGLENLEKAQKRMDIYLKKYKELCNTSGLLVKQERLRVANFKRVVINK